MSSLEDGVIFEVDGNEARVKYDAGLPLSPEEAVAVAKVDLDIWIPYKLRVNMWQIGRKKKTVDLDIVDGVMTGLIEDHGEIHKEYLYQIEVRLERRERIAIKPVIQPIQITNNVVVPNRKESLSQEFEKQSILFITDTHFGFRTERFEKPVAFHNRVFLSDLLYISKILKPTITIWGGDTLDLAGFSKFPNDPSTIYNTQIAALEAAWLINQFGMNTLEQKVIEGNHDVRMPKAVSMNFAAAYQLKPVHDLEGEPLISVPRLLGFEQSENIKWYGGYPNNFVRVGEVNFEHGNIARDVSGATASSMIKKRNRTTFFGHIHRYESVSKNTDDGVGYITMATPGCACRWPETPGSTIYSNWTNGAFLITLRNGTVSSIEHILHDRGLTFFRGDIYQGEEYIRHMGNDIPEKFMDAL